MAPVTINKSEPRPTIIPTLPRLLNFGSIKRQQKLVWPLPEGTVQLSVDLLKTLLRLALEQVTVDEQHYLQSNPDIVEAVSSGLFASARHHYIEFGFFEDRLPHMVEVDEDFYYKTNPDIATSVRAGVISSAQDHFEKYGYKEGRLPRENWSLCLTNIHHTPENPTFKSSK